jgi:DNA-binding IclR family transcriptional regulator
VLQAVSAGEGGSTLTDIAPSTYRPPSATTCATLDHEQLVSGDRRQPPRLGMRFKLAQRQHRSACHHQPDFCCHRKPLFPSLLMVENRGEALCVDRFEEPRAGDRGRLAIGSRLPLHCGGAPFAILAFSDDAFVDEFNAA